MLDLLQVTWRGDQTARFPRFLLLGRLLFLCASASRTRLRRHPGCLGRRLRLSLGVRLNFVGDEPEKSQLQLLDASGYLPNLRDEGTGGFSVPLLGHLEPSQEPAHLMFGVADLGLQLIPGQMIQIPTIDAQVLSQPKACW